MEYTYNVTNMSYLFYNCELLNSLPDISKWKTNNVETALNMIEGCDSLITFPDFKKWNLDKCKNDSKNLLSESFEEFEFSMDESSNSSSNWSKENSSFDNPISEKNISSYNSMCFNNEDNSLINQNNNEKLTEYYENFYE